MITRQQSIFFFWSRSVSSAAHHHMNLLCRCSQDNCLRCSFHRREGCARNHRTWAGPPRVVQRWRLLSCVVCVPCVVVDISPPHRHRHRPDDRPVVEHMPWKSDVSSFPPSLCGASSRLPSPHKVEVAAERTWMVVSGALVGCPVRQLGTPPSRRWRAALVSASPGAHDAPDAPDAVFY